MRPTISCPRSLGTGSFLRQCQLCLSLAQIVQVMQETTIGVRIVKSFNLEATMRVRMHRAVSDVERRANSIAALEAGTSPIMETLAGLAIAGVVLVSGYLVVQGGQTPGSIMSFITALVQRLVGERQLGRRSGGH